MKRLFPVASLALVVGVSLLFSPIARAQDPAKVAPDVYKVVFENARVRVMEVTLAPGAKVAMHSHPDHFAYGLSSGKVKFTHADGTTVEAEFQPGQVVWVPAEKHSRENPGDAEVKAVVVELKEPARKPAAKKS